MIHQELISTSDIKKHSNIKDLVEMYSQPFGFKGFYSSTNGIINLDDLHSFFLDEDVISQEIMYDNAGRFLGIFIERFEDIGKFDAEISFDDDEVGEEGDELFGWYSPEMGDGGDGVTAKIADAECVSGRK